MIIKKYVVFNLYPESLIFFSARKALTEQLNVNGIQKISSRYTKLNIFSLHKLPLQILGP